MCSASEPMQNKLQQAARARAWITELSCCRCRTAAASVLGAGMVFFGGRSCPEGDALLDLCCRSRSLSQCWSRKGEPATRDSVPPSARRPQPLCQKGGSSPQDPIHVAQGRKGGPKKAP